MRVRSEDPGGVVWVDDVAIHVVCYVAVNVRLPFGCARVRQVSTRRTEEHRGDFHVYFWARAELACRNGSRNFSETHVRLYARFGHTFEVCGFDGVHECTEPNDECSGRGLYECRYTIEIPQYFNVVFVEKEPIVMHASRTGLSGFQSMKVVVRFTYYAELFGRVWVVQDETGLEE